jgi:hypothetical protein
MVPGKVQENTCSQKGISLLERAVKTQVVEMKNVSGYNPMVQFCNLSDECSAYITRKFKNEGIINTWSARSYTIQLDDEIGIQRVTGPATMSSLMTEFHSKNLYNHKQKNSVAFSPQANYTD